MLLDFLTRNYDQMEASNIIMLFLCNCSKGFA